VYLVHGEQLISSTQGGAGVGNPPFDELAATWHPTKKGTLTPEDVTYSSRQRVWWQCPSNPHHVWDTTVNNRQGSNCPFCAGRFHRAIGSRHCPRRDSVAASAGMTRDMCVSATHNITLNLLAPPDKSA